MDEAQEPIYAGDDRKDVLETEIGVEVQSIIVGDRQAAEVQDGKNNSNYQNQFASSMRCMQLRQRLYHIDRPLGRLMRNLACRSSIVWSFTGHPEAAFAQLSSEQNEGESMEISDG